MKQTIIAKVENKPGVLNRIASLFRRRNFNIDSLNVGRTEDPDFSRMTLVVDRLDTEARKIEANLYKLVNVVDVQDVTSSPALLRELALIKVAAQTSQRAEVVSLASVFSAKVVDVSEHSVVVQVTAQEEKVDSLIELLRPFDIIEMVRTGHVAMVRGSGEGVRHTPGAGINGKNGTSHN
jgi:acetolactate synthase-1/3 small subunit